MKMYPRKLFFFSILAFLFSSKIYIVNGVDHPIIHPKSFCYDNPACDPNTWNGTCKTGKEQSPINIIPPRTGIDKLTLKPTKFIMNSAYSNVNYHEFYGQNNGHTAQFELNSNASALSSSLKICGGHLSDCYNFAQLHFHWGKEDQDGSEHTIDKTRFALELHLVHYKSIYQTLNEALDSNDREAVAVMAILYRIGKEDNPALNPIVEAIKTLTIPGDISRFKFPLNFSAFYPTNSEFARYLGSLTTPTCDEKVVWTVFLTPESLSETQMDEFRKMRNNEGVSEFNFRPTQILNERIINFYKI